MISELTVKKTADKMVWGDGKLTYTIEIDNQTNYCFFIYFFHCLFPIP